MVNGNCGWWYWMLLQPVGKPLNQRSSKTLLAMFENFLTFQIRVRTLVVMMIIGGHLLFIIIILRMFAILIMWMVITEWWCWWSKGQRRAVTAWESPSAGTRRKKKQDFEREGQLWRTEKSHIWQTHLIKCRRFRFFRYYNEMRGPFLWQWMWKRSCWGRRKR